MDTHKDELLITIFPVPLLINCLNFETDLKMLLLLSKSRVEI